MRMRKITDDAMEVHFDLRLLDRAADHAYCHNYPGVNQAQELQHLQCWSLEQHPQRHIHEVDEARLCGSSLPTGPIALPALLGFEPKTFRPALRRPNHYSTGACGKYRFALQR